MRWKRKKRRTNEIPKWSLKGRCVAHSTSCGASNTTGRPRGVVHDLSRQRTSSKKAEESKVWLARGIEKRNAANKQMKERAEAIANDFRRKFDYSPIRLDKRRLDLLENASVDEMRCALRILQRHGKWQECLHILYRCPQVGAKEFMITANVLLESQRLFDAYNLLRFAQSHRYYIPHRVVHSAVRACKSAINTENIGRELIEELLLELESRERSDPFLKNPSPKSMSTYSSTQSVRLEPLSLKFRTKSKMKCTENIISDKRVSSYFVENTSIGEKSQGIIYEGPGYPRTRSILAEVAAKSSWATAEGESHTSSDATNTSKRKLKPSLHEKEDLLSRLLSCPPSTNTDRKQGVRLKGSGSKEDDVFGGLGDLVRTSIKMHNAEQIKRIDAYDENMM